MLDKLKNILLKYIDVPPEAIIPESSLRDFGLTSYDIINIVADCEDEFGSVVPDNEIRKFQTVNDILVFFMVSKNADIDSEP